MQHIHKHPQGMLAEMWKKNVLEAPVREASSCGSTVNRALFFHRSYRFFTLFVGGLEGFADWTVGGRMAGAVWRSERGSSRLRGGPPQTRARTNPSQRGPSEGQLCPGGRLPLTPTVLSVHSYL